MPSYTGLKERSILSRNGINAEIETTFKKEAKQLGCFLDKCQRHSTKCMKQLLFCDYRVGPMVKVDHNDEY